MSEDLSRFAGSLAPVQAAPAAVAWTPTTVVAQRPRVSASTSRTAGSVAGAAGLLTALGSFLPWFAISAGPADVSFNGMHAGLHGTLTLIAGGVCALIAAGIVLGAVPRATWGAVTLLGVVGLGVALFELHRVGDAAGKVNQFAGVFNESLASEGLHFHAHAGLGLWLVLVGAVVTVGASAVAALTD